MATHERYCAPPPTRDPPPHHSSSLLPLCKQHKASSTPAQPCTSSPQAVFDMLQLFVTCLSHFHASRQGCVRACGVQAGVRSLSRSLAAMCRHVAVQIVSQQDHAQAQPHQALQDSSTSVFSKHNLVHQIPQSSIHAQQQQQQQQHHQHHQHQHQEELCARKPQDMHATSDQPCQSTHADLKTNALEASLQPGATASAGSFLWGGLWGGLRGAFSPPRQHPVGLKRRRKASHQLSQASTHPGHSHLHPADVQTSHAVHAEHEHAGASASQHPHQRYISKAVFSPDLESVPSTAGSAALNASMVGSTTSADEGHHQAQASNLHGGVNADMVKAAHSKVTVTSELVEEVLGPRKYNETDSADNLVTPGDLSDGPHLSATWLQSVASFLTHLQNCNFCCDSVCRLACAYHTRYQYIRHFPISYLRIALNNMIGVPVGFHGVSSIQRHRCHFLCCST